MDVVRMRDTGNTHVELPIFTGFDDVAGTVYVKIPPGKRLEHQGIKVELVGQLGRVQKFLCSQQMRL